MTSLSRISSKLTFRTFLYLFLTVLSVQAVRSSSAAQSRPTATSPSRIRARPSLDSLLSRVNAYWALLEKGNKAQAKLYVATASRERFLGRQTPAFSNPKVAGLDFSGKSDEVTVRVTVRRTLPGMGPVDWPVSERWVFRNDNWFAVIPDTAMPYSASGPRKEPPSLSPEEAERRRNEILSSLHFETRTIDFGTVRKGMIVPLELKCRLDAGDPVRIEFKDGPSDLIMKDQPTRELKAGADETVDLQLITQSLDGQVNAPFILIARRGGVEAAYSFELKGEVYSPLSSLPVQLVFRAGQQQQELTVVNNSSSEVTIGRIYSGSSAFEVRPLPAVLPPGGKAVLNVRLVFTISQQNYRDMMSLMLDHPVEEMQSLIIPVVVNPREKPKEKRIMGLTQRELDELIRKAQPQPIKP